MGIPLRTVNHTVTRLRVTTGVIGTIALIGSLVLAGGLLTTDALAGKSRPVADNAV